VSGQASEWVGGCVGEWGWVSQWVGEWVSEGVSVQECCTVQ